MIVVGRDDRFVAVAQVDHARMCGQLARAWGNERFGAVEPLEVVSLAAEEHELGMLEWDRAPALDTATGLPYSVKDLDLAVHLPLQVSGPRVLGEQDPYAGLLASLKHASMYAQPSRLGLVRHRRRQIRWFLDQSRTLQAQLRTRVGAPDEQIERNWRLVRTWDGLSHDLLHERAPCVRSRVPTAAGEVELRLERRDRDYTLDPWPFDSERVTVGAQARELHRRFADEAEMRAALAAAPVVELSYQLVAP